MEKVLVNLLLCCAFLIGCGKNNATESDRTVLARMERISNLWSNDFCTAYQDVKILGELSPTSSFFRSEALCRRYETFINQLEFGELSLSDRIDFGNRSFMTLTHAFDGSARTFTRNNEFLFRVYAEYIRKLRREHDWVRTQLGRLLPCSEDSPDTLVKSFASREEATEYHRQSRERHARRKELFLLSGYRNWLAFVLEKYPRIWFDAPDCRDRINAIPEPRRTELIDYIESRLGRRMKWRE